MDYSPPTVTELGTIRELTLAMNKVGTRSDIYSNTVPLVGSLVSPPSS